MPAIDVPPNFITMRGMRAPWVAGSRPVRRRAWRRQAIAARRQIGREAHFGKLAADWWDPNGASAMLHKLNPVRLNYIRDQIDQHWQCDECSRDARSTGKTRARRRLRRGAAGRAAGAAGRARSPAIDAAPELIAVAREHADAAWGSRSTIAPATSRQLEGQFDLVTCMEVIEHVADPAAFVDGAGAAARARRAADPVDAQRAPAGRSC